MEKAYRTDREPVNLYYPGAECPDCGEPIGDDKVVGDQCDGCEHVFSQDRQPGEECR